MNNGMFNDANYTIYNTMGSVAHLGKLEQNSINISSLKKGIYYLRIHDKIVYTKKLILK